LDILDSSQLVISWQSGPRGYRLSMAVRAQLPPLPGSLSCSSARPSSATWDGATVARNTHAQQTSYSLPPWPIVSFFRGKVETRRAR